MVDSTDKGIGQNLKVKKMVSSCFPHTFKMNFVSTMLQDHFTNVRKMTINMKYIGIPSDSLSPSC